MFLDMLISTQFFGYFNFNAIVIIRHAEEFAKTRLEILKRKSE